MIILHAGWLQQQLMIWGEAPAEVLPNTARKRGSKTTAKRAPSYPYQAGQATLFNVMEALFHGVQLVADDTLTAHLWLPTVAGQPLASSPLIAEPPSSETPPEVTKWTVTTLPLRAVEAMDLLCLCVDHTTLAPGILIGSDLAYWARALRFTGTLLARQQLLPSVQETAGVWQAVWEPVMAGADQLRLTTLAQAMPHVARALTASDATVSPDVPALSCLTEFIREMMNSLVRASAVTTRQPAKTTAKKTARAMTFDSLHDQWLQALRSDDSMLQGTSTELQSFAANVQEWQRPLTVTTTAPFRLCFRLEEPVEADEEAKPRRRAAVSDWHVRYLLQAADDPSLLVPVQEAWQPKGKTSAVLQRGAFAPREYLLATLGQAAGISPNIEQSLKAATPSGYDLDATGAHQFLTEHAWLLEQSGFGVMLPAWWTRKGTKLSLSARARVTSPKFQGSGGLSLSAVVQFDWEMALGDQTLSRKELEALAQLKAPLVKVRGQWVQLNADEIQAALAFWKKNPTGQATVRELVQMSLGVGRTPGGVALAGVQATGWIGDFLAQLSGTKTFAPLPTPEPFQGTLRPYQTRGFSWLAFLREWGLGACLADDMGLGKTVQTLALLERDWHQHDQRPTLLVCPMSVVGNWQKEAARFTPDLPVMIHHGLGRQKGAAFKKKAMQQALIISSYSLLHRDQSLFADIHWSGVILDEAQNIKNAETKQSRAARALKADYRIALTGTPVENNVGDLWSILEFLNPGFLGTQSEFRRKFFLPIQAQRDADATAKLKRLTTPFILRRVKTDKAIISDLPDKIEMKVFCSLTKEQASLYAAVVENISQELNDAEGIQRKGLVLATLMKLKQVCNHPAQLLGDNSALPGRSGKLARLTEMLEEALATGDRALIFTQFAEMGTMLRQHLQETFGQEVLFLHGAVPQKKREQMVERFQQPNGPSLFILSLKAGGTGLNLTAANHVFHFDRWWNPAVENQATDRAFRIGQQRNVQVHKFLCAGTLEEKIDEMIERKQTIASSIVGTGEGWLTELSNEALQELFALRADAIGE